jgi:hypothetical protein
LLECKFASKSYAKLWPGLLTTSLPGKLVASIKEPGEAYNPVEYITKRLLGFYETLVVIPVDGVIMNEGLAPLNRHAC